MDRLTIINTSPLIFLSQGGMISLLQILNHEIIVPQAVYDEISVYGANDKTAKILQETDWLKVQVTYNVPTIITNWDLGRGESEVLTWGYMNRGAEIVVDDLAARRCAMTLDIPVRGTLGLVLLAKKRGIIPLARPVLEQLKKAGMYLSNSVINQALAQVGEQL